MSEKMKEYTDNLRAWLVRFLYFSCEPPVPLYKHNDLAGHLNLTLFRALSGKS